MDLAEVFAIPIEQLETRLTDREIAMWLARGKPLWPRRLEIMLAQLTTAVNRSAGGRGDVADFDVFAPAQPVDDAGADVAADAFAGGTIGVSRLGQGRKRQGGSR